MGSHTKLHKMIQTFLGATKPFQSEPVLVILDGHWSHSHNIEVIDLTRENHVSNISLSNLILFRYSNYSKHKLQLGIRHLRDLLRRMKK